MTKRSFRQVFEDGDGRLSFGRVGSGVAVVAWLILLGFAGLKDGAHAATDAFVATAPQLTVLVASFFGISKGGDAIEGLRGGPRPPKGDL